jgi:hypothetical protein
VASPENQLRSDYAGQMATTTVPGTSTPVGQLIGCVYCLLDFDGHPLYVGQSTGADERLGERVGRHVLGQRSDAAGRCFPPYEVHSIQIYPLRKPPTKAGALTPTEKARVNRAEAQLYVALAKTPVPPLNEKQPKAAGSNVLMPLPITVPFTTDPTLIAILWDHDLRVERWVDVIKVMASRVRTSGGTKDQRRVLEAQIERLALLV